jgi:acyl-CoA reductase-like NAD-dependent aldehyde dehydrogenase
MYWENKMATAKKTTKKTTTVKPKVELKGVTVAAKAEAKRSADAVEQAALLAATIAKKAAEEAADAAKKAAERFEQANREMQKMNTLSKSQGWLAALTRSAGPTQENFGGFIEVPVVIDGQTVFRATQKYSLINNRRNVSNGLATSGSLI